MAFHFRDARVFMSVHMEDRFPIASTSSPRRRIAAGQVAQVGAVFCAIRDELTLEMVTDEDRDYMYRVVRPPTRRRGINLGIRRRLSSPAWAATAWNPLQLR